MRHNFHNIKSPVTRIIATAVAIALNCALTCATVFNDFIHTFTYDTTVGNVYVDKNGVAWLGTSRGVMTYDVLNHDRSLLVKDIKILHTPIYMIYGLSDSRLIVTTIELEKYIFDPITWETEQLDREWLNNAGIDAEGDWEISIASHPDADAVVTTKNKIYLLDPSNRKARLVMETDEEINKISVDSDCYHILTSHNILTYDFADRKIRKTHNPYDIYAGHVIKDRNGNIWLGDRDLYRYDILTGEWQIIDEGIVVTGIVKSGKDIYAGTNMSGLRHYKDDGEKVKSIRNNPFDDYSPLSNHCRTIYIDNAENLWLIYNKCDFSISSPHVNLTKPHHIAQLAEQRVKDDIISLTPLENGHLLAGTDGNGIYCIDPDSGICQRQPWTALGDITDKSVTASFVDSRGRLWLGCYRDGLSCISNTGIARMLPGTSPFSIDEDINGFIYVATSGNGLYRLDPDLANTPEKVDLGEEIWIQQLTCNRGNTILVASANKLFSINAHSLAVTDITTDKDGNKKIECQYFNSIYRDSRSLLWIIGKKENNGLEIIDLKNGTAIHVDGMDGTDFKSIIEDDNKSMWLTSSNDIYNIVPQYDYATKRYSFRHYVYHIRGNDDHSNTYNYRSAARMPDGHLIFGGINGYQIINPNLYQELVVSTHLAGVFSALKVNNEFIVPGMEYGGRVILKKGLSLTDRISLRHDQNSITLLFSPSDHNSPFITDYYYRLDRSHSEWKVISGNLIELTNLAPGKYRLEVCAMSPDGYMSETVDSIEIVVLSPWYLSWWAYLVYIAALCGAILFVFHHYSDRQKQNLRVLQAEKEVARQRQLNEMKLRFFTNISHDFRTPLSLIITPLETFLNDNPDSRSLKFLIPVHRNAVKLLNLVNQILDFRKLEVTGIPLRMSYSDIVGFVREICLSFTLFSEDSGISLNVNSNVGTLNMYFDKDKLTKIMMNLLSNAFKYTDNGGDVTVSIKADNKTVRLCVADTGKGVPDKDKERIFDRFYQSEQTNHTTMGCGIGLHIVKEFVLLHNGNVRVVDNNPKGSVFIVEIPIVKSIQNEGEYPLTQVDCVEDISGNSTHYSSRKDEKTSILLVEDNQDFIDFMADTLSDEYNVYKAYNGKEALGILENESVDIVISDVMMNEMDGFELCKAIKNDIRISHIPVILLTARIMAEDELKGLELGADDYITKPFNMPVLRLRVRKRLDDNKKLQDKFRKIPDISPSEVTITPLDEKFLSDAIRIVEENMANPEFSVEMLSSLLNMHRTHLYKKLLCITGKTPIEFIRLIRLKRAEQYLRKSQMYISEIAYKVGFNNPRLFSKYFKEEFNLTPREYMKSLGIETSPGMED